MLHSTKNQARLLARVVWDLLKSERYTCLADLTADVKSRCARLRLRVTADDLNAAYTLIESNAALVVDPVSAPPPAADVGDPISREDARDILRALGIGAPGRAMRDGAG